MNTERSMQNPGAPISKDTPEIGSGAEIVVVKAFTFKQKIYNLLGLNPKFVRLAGSDYGDDEDEVVMGFGR